jgi:hypothetical protein
MAMSAHRTAGDREVRWPIGRSSFPIASSRSLSQANSLARTGRLTRRLYSAARNTAATASRMADSGSGDGG